MASILIIDPRRKFRKDLAAALADTDEVRSAARAPDRLGAEGAPPPDLVVLSYLQSADSNGLEVAQALRATGSAEAAVLLVYGQAAGRAVPDVERRLAEQRYKADAWIPFGYAPPELAERIRSLQRQLTQAEKRLRTTQERLAAIGNPQLAVQSARVERPARTLGDILNQPLTRIDDLDDKDDPTWAELLRGRANASNLMKLLKKEVFTSPGRKAPTP
jgi:DNA-binding response OmpR family regulator